jgi:hypothetical protein
MFSAISLEDLISRQIQLGNSELAEALKQCANEGKFKYLPSFCETRWWGNYALVSRIVKFLPVLVEYYKTNNKD